MTSCVLHMFFLLTAKVTDLDLIPNQESKQATTSFGDEDFSGPAPTVRRNFTFQDSQMEHTGEPGGNDITFGNHISDLAPDTIHRIYIYSVCNVAGCTPNTMELEEGPQGAVDIPRIEFKTPADDGESISHGTLFPNKSASL